MRKDPTEFRNRFVRWKQGLPAYKDGKAVSYDDTIEFLKQYEGFRDTVYKDGNGIPTIGYGFTDKDLINKGAISQKDADDRLVQELQTREQFLSNLKNWENLSENSKTALRSYYYNYPAGFNKSTKFYKAWDSGNYAEAVKQIDAGMNDAKNKGLRKRRLAEQELLKQDPFLFPQPEVPYYIANPDKLKVSSIIPQEKIIHTWDNVNASPYVTGKPMINLKPKINIPTAAEVAEDIRFKPTGTYLYNNTEK